MSENLIELRIHGEKIPFRYVEETANADAYYAGTDEGHRLAREHLEREKSNAT